MSSPARRPGPSNGSRSTSTAQAAMLPTRAKGPLHLPHFVWPRLVKLSSEQWKSPAVRGVCCAWRVLCCVCPRCADSKPPAGLDTSGQSLVATCGLGFLTEFMFALLYG